MTITDRTLKTYQELGIEDLDFLLKEVLQLDVDWRGQEGYFLCPSHEDHTPSASVNRATGYWHCWSCGSGGDSANLGGAVFKMSRHRFLRNVVPDDPSSRREMAIRALRARKRLEKTEEPDAFQKYVHDPSEFADGPLTYMQERGFKLRTLRDFGVKYAGRVQVKTLRGKNMNLYEVVCIPLHDEQGDLEGWCFRSTSDKFHQPRYFYTTGWNARSAIFGLDKIDPTLHRDVVVTEGAIDAMWCWQAGYPTIAVYGASNTSSPEKVERISDFWSITLFGDRDRAGVMFVSNFGELLRIRSSVRVCQYKATWRGTDPNSLTPSETAYAIDRAIPYAEWVIKHSI